MNVKRSGSAAATSTTARLVLPVSVTTAAPVTFSRELSKYLEVLLNGCREDDEIRLGQHHRIVCGNVDGVQYHRALEHVLPIDPNDETGRPDLPRRKRDRSSDEP